MTKRVFILVVIIGSIVCGNASAHQYKLQKGKYVGGVYFSEELIGKSYPSLAFPIDTVYSFPTPGTWPGGLARDDSIFWITDLDSLQIYKVDSSGNMLASYPNPSGATSSGCSGGLAWDSSYLWFVSEQSGQLYKIDTGTWTVVDIFNLPEYGASDPNSFGIAWDGNYLWHSQYSSNCKIFKINPSNGNAIDSFIPPTESILGIEWVNGYIYGVDCQGLKIYKMDPINGSVVDSSDWPVPYPLGLAWDGSCWWNVSSAIWAGGNQRVYKLCGWPGVAEEDEEPLSIIKNYPNPVISGTYIEYDLPKATVITLKLYDITGRDIRTLIAETQESGRHGIYWDGTNDNGQRVATGVYFYRIGTSDFRITRNLTILR